LFENMIAYVATVFLFYFVIDPFILS
jgi:hypothetical protein